ncbi:MAG: hypothetical protein JSW66_20675 [Phycisphaerales bacterium]|nr:MAG: hypothetical protein JSW66_20675 [Phycisphaerales bacterium]
MYKHTFIFAALFSFVISAASAQDKSDEHATVPTITITKLDIGDKALNLTYEIGNDCDDDAWILVGWYKFSDSIFGMGAGVLISEDGHTLTIRARFNGPTTGIGFEPLYGRFVRLRPGDSQTESIFMTIPAYPIPQFGHVGQQEQVIEHATRLAIELGYYRGSLPERILKTLKPPENVFPEDPNDPLVSPDAFSMCNECLNSRDDELLILEGCQEVKSEEERVIRTVIENLSIPYEEKRNHTTRIKSPGLASYEKIEIQYRPSILEFFFPYGSQQSLLSPDEIGYLQSDKTIVLNDRQDIHTVADYIPNTRAPTTVIVGIPVRYRSHAEVVCYSEGKPFLSFSICNDDEIVIEGKYLISFEGFPSLKKLTPQIRAIDLRMHCAANLKNQWYRLRFYNLHEALRQNDPTIRKKTLYPGPTDWCDDMLRPYPALGGFAQGKCDAEPHICPSAGKGKNHYAMNPNCRPDSLPDMVLLFETKAGWNQQGGPELFTFDNHDPKGGCVLLNDGTVKFIRTKEELQQLRWK